MKEKVLSVLDPLQEALISSNFVQGIYSAKRILQNFGWCDALGLNNIRCKSATQNGSSDGYSTVVIAAGVASAAMTVIGVKSICTMVSWRLSLRDVKTNGPAAGPTPFPFIGNIIDLRANYYETLYRFVNKPASVFWVLSTPFVVINEEEGLRRVLGGSKGLYTKPKYFGYRSKAVKSAVQSERDNVANESIEYQPNGDTSRMALENMVDDSLQDIKISMHRLLRMLEKASENANKDEREDSVKSIRRCIVSLNLQVLFGLVPGHKHAEDANRVADMIEFAGTEFARRMVNPLKVLVDIAGNMRYFRDVGGLISLGRRLCAVLDEAAKDMEKKIHNGVTTLRSSASGVSWVHAWIGKVGKIGKLGKVVGLLMASTQTVPLTAAWMLHLVANDEAVRNRLSDELERFGIKSVEDMKYEDLEKMDFMDGVVKETLRLYPPFPLIQRQAQDNDILGGIRIPNGTIVYVVPWLVHRNPAIWKEADSFKPERFSDGNKSHGDAKSDWAYIPFGRGPRMCAGSKLAMAELKVLLCHAILSFKIKSEVADGNKRFPELGMMPVGMKMTVRSEQEKMKMDELL